jgi:hypothetical protein
MKRNSDTAELGQPQVFTRQQPSSCALCRRRKLKCDRADPCSNCKVRGIECIPAAKPVFTTAVAPATASTTLAPPAPPAVTSSNAVSQKSNVETRKPSMTTIYGALPPAQACQLPPLSTYSDDAPSLQGSRNASASLSSASPYPPLTRTPAQTVQNVMNLLSEPAQYLGPGEQTPAGPPKFARENNTWWGRGFENHTWSSQGFPNTTSYGPITNNDNGMLTPASSRVENLDAVPEEGLGSFQSRDYSTCALRLEAEATGLAGGKKQAATPMTDGILPAMPPSFNSLIAGIPDMTSGKPFAAADILKLLPEQSKARRLLDHYIDCIHWAYHICHTPTLHNMVKVLYADNKTLNAGELALLAAVLAISAYYGSPSLGMGDTSDLGTKLMALSQKAMTDANYLHTPTLETVQAHLVLGYTILAETGEMATTLLSLRAAIHCSQTLGLHRIDSPRERRIRDKSPTKVDHIRLEMTRRTWWHLCASDW